MGVWWGKGGRLHFRGQVSVNTFGAHMDGGLILKGLQNGWEVGARRVASFPGSCITTPGLP